MSSITKDGLVGVPVKKKRIGEPSGQTVQGTGNPLATDYTQLALGAVSPDRQTSNQYLDEYQRLADAKDYSTLLDKAISDYNMKVQTQKYLDNTLRNGGLGDSGYAQSMQAGTQNAYMNLLGTDYSAYAQSVAQNRNNALERQENAQKESDEQLVTYLNAAQTAAQVDSIMRNYGYTRNDSGQWVDANGNAASPYVSTMADLANSNSGGDGRSFTVDELSQLAGGEDYDKGTMNDIYGDELKAVSNKAGRNELKPDEVIKLKSGKGGTQYIRYNSDGTFSLASEEEWNAAENKSTVFKGKWQKELPDDVKKAVEKRQKEIPDDVKKVLDKRYPNPKAGDTMALDRKIYVYDGASWKRT